MKHITSDKGDIGVAKATADLIIKGYPVFTPVSASCPFDLLIYKDGFKRVQIKYRNISKTGTLDVTLIRHANLSSKITSYKNEEVDIVCIYCPDTDRCYYIDSSKFDKCISLRMNKLKINRVKSTHFADDYLSI